MLWGVAEAQTITYTPMTAAGYRYKYLLADSGFNLPMGDTAIKRGSPRPGALICNSADSVVYRWDGLKWISMGNVGLMVQAGVDSITINGPTLCSWTSGASTCYVLPYSGNTLVLSGSIVWDSLFVFHNTDLTYLINGRYYSAAGSSITVTGLSGVYDQYFSFYADTLGNVGYILGGVNPTDIPGVDDNSQVLIATYFVAANDTIPQGLSNEVIYKENVEWTVSGSAKYNPLWTSDVFAGTYALRDSSNTIRTYIDLVDSNSTHSSADFWALTYQLRLDATFANNQSLQIQFLNNSSVVSSTVTVATGRYGYTRTVSGTYQAIAVPLSAWTFTSSTFNKVRFIVANTNVNGFNLDNIVLQQGGYNAAGTVVNSFQGGDGSTPRSGNVIFKSTDDPFSGKGIDTNYNGSKYVLVNIDGTVLDSVTTFRNILIGDSCIVYTVSNDTIYTTFNQNCGGSGGGGITALTGDVTASGTGSVAATLATVNSDIGSFTNASITVNGKGLITAASSGTTITTSEQVVVASGSTTVTFTSVPASYNDYLIFRNGVLNESTTDYTTSGNNVTITGLITGDRVTFRRTK